MFPVVADALLPPQVRRGKNKMKYESIFQISKIELVCMGFVQLTSRGHVALCGPVQVLKLLTGTISFEVSQ